MNRKNVINFAETYHAEDTESDSKKKSFLEKLKSCLCCCRGTDTTGLRLLIEMFDNLKLSNFYYKAFIQGEAEEVFQMQGEDERREDNTTGEEETTFTTSPQVSLVFLQN